MNVEVIWDNLSKENTCSIDDLIVLNRENLFESYVTWKYDPKWKGSIARDYAPISRQNFNPSRHMQLQIRENNGYCEELSNEEDETESRKVQVKTPIQTTAIQNFRILSKIICHFPL